MYMVIGYYINSGCGHVLHRAETLEECNAWINRQLEVSPIEDFDNILVTKVISIDGDTRF